MAGLGLAHQMGVIELGVKADSQVVVNQLLGLYTIKGKKLKKYLAKVWELHEHFSHFSVIQIPKTDNEVANRLAKVASSIKETLLSWPASYEKSR